MVKVYVDLRSQPCRALVIFLRNTKIPFETVAVDLFKGDNMKPEYLKINSLGTVPAIQDGDFCLGETVAIIRYLANKYADLVPDHWFPKNLEKRAKVDEYLAFHHTGTRGGCSRVFYQEFAMPLFTQGKQHATEEMLTSSLENMKKQLDKLERAFLQNNNWLAGEDITVADILASCELMQNTASGRDVTEGRPLLKAYLARVKNRLNPAFDDVSSILQHWADGVKK